MLRFESWKIALVAALALLGVAWSLPNFLSGRAVDRLPGWLPNQQINLGLDLRGGSHLLAEVEVGLVVEKFLETVVDDVRRRLRPREGNRIDYVDLARDSGGVSFALSDPADRERVIPLLDELNAAGEFATSVSEDGRARLALNDDAAATRKRNAVTQTIEIVRRRLDELGTTEPTIQRSGEDRVLIQVPGFDDPQGIKDLLGQTASLDFRMVDERGSVQDALEGRSPPGSELLYEPDRGSGPIPILVRKRADVTGENLDLAQATVDQFGRPAVAIRFDTSGARKFGRLTAENVGRRFAIVLDGEVISAPEIQEAIPGGNGQITGNFTVETAEQLAILLRAGALPAPLTYLEERTVGPSLGADSIAAGKVAAAVGLAAVIAYMILSYGLFGVAATVALSVNMALIVAALSALQATLTLPGIAGIVLTIGMAVDANVLVFERIREETRNGRTPVSAVDIGFRQALRTIIDANVTTLIAAVILFQFGSGPVRGFAVTLAIGIVTSVFTAMMVTRLLIVLWLGRARPQALPV